MKNDHSGRPLGIQKVVIPCARVTILSLVLTVFFITSSNRALAASPDAGETQSIVTFTLDGVNVSLQSSYLPNPKIVTSTPGSVNQVATSTSWRPFRELTIAAIPFGTKPGTESLALAQVGSAERYRLALRNYRMQQGGSPQTGPTATLFGNKVVGQVSLVELNLDSETPKPTLITEWVIEAGKRVWLVRYSEEQTTTKVDLSPTSPLFSALGNLTLSSDTLDNPSTIRAGNSSTNLPFINNGLVPNTPTDLPSPGWWNGDCDYNTYYSGSGGWSSYRLGAVYQGMPACGPRPYYGAPDVTVHFFSGAFGVYEWECVELAMRYLYLVYGVNPYSANGSQVVWNYSGSALQKIGNGTSNAAPQPGDVLSYGSTSTAGHTSVVTSSSVDGNGNGSITVIEENNSSNGSTTMSVSNWTVNGNPYSVSGWLHKGGGGSAPSTPSNPNPSDGATLSRTNDTWLYWSTNGSSCDVHVWGGNININPTGGSCSSLHLGNQYGGSYQWQVTAYNSYGKTIGPTWHFNIKPYAPTNLNASTGSSSSINLSWTKSSDDPGSVDNYKIYYSNGSYIATVNAGTTNYTAGSLTCGTSYSFYVTAVRQGVESDASNTAGSSTSSCGQSPSTPSNPNPSDNATVDRTNNTTFYWSTNGTSCDIHIWGGPSINISQNGIGCSSFFWGVQWPGAYQWQVTAHNNYGMTPGLTWHLNIRPYPPTNLSASAGSQTQINLSWTKSNDDPGSVDAYNIYYSNGNNIAQVSGGTTNASVSNLTCGTSYSFYVTAVRQGVESNASNTASSSTQDCPIFVLVKSVWTTDGNYNIKSAFNPGDSILYGGDVYNSSSSSQTAYLSWSVNGPCGSIASWSGNLTIASGDASWYLPTTVPSDASGGAYTYQLSVTFNGSTTSQTATFTVAPNGIVVTSVTTTDYYEKTKTIFNAGDTIGLWIYVTNRTGGLANFTLSWDVYDPKGAKISALSWDNVSESDDTSESGGICWSGWFINQTIPSTALAGGYTFRGTSVYGGASSLQTTQFIVVSPKNIYLPFVKR